MKYILRYNVTETFSSSWYTHGHLVWSYLF